jgi:hypothetical protein
LNPKFNALFFFVAPMCWQVMVAQRWSNYAGGVSVVGVSVGNSISGVVSTSRGGASVSVGVFVGVSVG